MWGIERMLAFFLRAAGSDWKVSSLGKVQTWKDSHMKGYSAAECGIDCRAGVVGPDCTGLSMVTNRKCQGSGWNGQ